MHGRSHSVLSSPYLNRRRSSFLLFHTFHLSLALALPAIAAAPSSSISHDLVGVALVRALVGGSRALRRRRAHSLRASSSSFPSRSLSPLRETSCPPPRR